jgi:hypothetical protein
MGSGSRMSRKSPFSGFATRDLPVATPVRFKVDHFGTPMALETYRTQKHTCILLKMHSYSSSSHPLHFRRIAVQEMANFR